MIFDAHAHYDDKAFDDDREEIIEKMLSTDVYGIVNSAVDEETQNFGIEYAEKYERMWTTIGYHPENAEKAKGDYIEKMAKLMEHKKAVAIGEIGLDYYWKDVPKEIQMKVFEEQLKLAKELNVPVVVHDREAHLDTYTMLKKYQPKGIVHCFSGSLEFSREIVKLGMSISIGGVLTFKNARQSVEVIKDINIEKVLLETDAPYLSPVPFRGKRCNSSMIKYVAEKIEEIKGIKSEEVLKITLENALQMYNIEKIV